MPAWVEPKDDWAAASLIPETELDKFANASIHNHEDMIMSGALSGTIAENRVYTISGVGVVNRVPIQSLSFTVPDQYKIVVRACQARLGSDSSHVQFIVHCAGVLSYTDYLPSSAVVNTTPNFTLATNTTGSPAVDEVIFLGIYLTADAPAYIVEQTSWSVKLGIESL